MMSLDPEFLKKKLAGKMVGHCLHYYEEIGSTNDEAFRLGEEGAQEGTVLIAERQSSGKGRMQRRWYSPPGANIYTSVILRPPVGTIRVTQIPIAAGVAAAETLNEFCPDKARIKWPNDVLIGGKKVCGILAQIKMSGQAVDFIVVGIGINVNLEREQFPQDIQEIATSMVMEAGREISRPEVIIRLYENMAKWYRELTRNGFNTVRERWLNLSEMIGRTVSVMFQNETVRGKAVGLDEDGALILRNANNQNMTVSAGDATILKEVNTYAAGN
jgi:BirA family biotin operon repressor/biotin-[acetyl-CoA-carboxylase] ligase